MLVLPSKELLSEVLNEVCPIVEIKKFKNNNLLIKYQNQYQKTINIHELAHKCKEWASNNQFTLVSGDSGHGFVCSVGHYSNNAINAEFYGENEFNAVIQGCEWILKEHPCNQLT